MNTRFAIQCFDYKPRVIGYLRFDPAAGKHFAILIAAWLLLIALRLWLVDAPQLLYSTTGPLVGASYTDLHATLPALRVTAVLALIGAVMVLVGGMRGTLARYGLWAVAGYLLAALLGRGLLPFALQKLVVAPTELTRETPYLKFHIAATRAAWAIELTASR